MASIASITSTGCAAEPIRLTAVPRPPGVDGGNLFVRLAPRTARRLASLLPPPSGFVGAVAVCNGDDNGLATNAGALKDPTAAVDFLPLEIVFNPQDKGDLALYASYNGGPPAPAALVKRPRVCGLPVAGDDDAVEEKGIHDIIELPMDLHPSLIDWLGSTCEVLVRPLSHVPVGVRVTFEPLSVSDWEMIEMEASVLEDGGLLSQITIVYSGQVFPLRLGGRTGSLEAAAWVRVLDTTSDSESSVPFSENSVMSFESNSDTDTDSSIDSSDYKGHEIQGSAVRLAAETEVLVVPKPRKHKGDSVEEESKKSIYCPSPPIRVQPVSSDVCSAGLSAHPPFPNPPLGSVCVHPATLRGLPGYKQCYESLCDSLSCDSQTQLPTAVVTVRKVNRMHDNHLPKESNAQEKINGCDVSVAIIYASKFVHEGHVGMHPLLCWQLGVTPLADWVSVQVWSKVWVVDMINCVREGMATLELKQVHLSPQKHPSVLEPWKIPDGFNDAMPLANSMDGIRSLCMEVIEFGNADMFLSPLLALTAEHSCGQASLFSPGSLIPGKFIQHLGGSKKSDWLEPSNLYDTFIVKSGDSTTSDTSCFIPIITARDLKTIHFISIGHEELSHFPLLMPMLPESTLGFSPAIQSLQHFFRETVHCTPPVQSKINGSNPFICPSESVRKHAVMITGEEGSGKTHLSLASASRISASELSATVYLDCKKLQAMSLSIQFIMEEIQKSFIEALHKQPAVLVLDDLDAIIPNIESDPEGSRSVQHDDFQAKIIIDHLLSMSRHCEKSARRNSSSKSAGVVLICTCRNSLSDQYKKSGIFRSHIEVPSLTSSQRAQFLQKKMFRAHFTSKKSMMHGFSRIGKGTGGFRPKDLKIVATRTGHLGFLRDLNNLPPKPESGSEGSLKALEEDIASVIEGYSPLAQKLEDIDHNPSSTDWGSIGGLYGAKQCLNDVVIHPTKFKPVYDRAPMALPSGLLLYGPPGSGKSFIVPLLAKHSRLNLITCRGPELLDRYIGASEAKVRQLFARAEAAAPSMIFFDEFDALAPQRGSDHTGVTDRVVNQLLTLLDGAEQSKNVSHTFVVAATSRPEKIDKALLRPGRLEKHVFVGYPESVAEWNSLFSSIVKTMNIDNELSQLIEAGDLYNYLCNDFDHARKFSAADMKAVLDTAYLLCVHDILLGAKDRDKPGAVFLTTNHVREALRKTRPSLLPEDRHRFEKIYSLFRNNQTKDEFSELKTALR